MSDRDREGPDEPVDDGLEEGGEAAAKHRSKAAEEAAALAEAFLEQLSRGDAGLDADELDLADGDDPEGRDPEGAGEGDEESGGIFRRRRRKTVASAITRELEARLAEADAKVEALTAERDQHYQARLRMQADFENLRKRLAREKSEAVDYANEELLREILPTIDNLERALEHAAREGESTGPIVDGVQITLNQFRQTLQKVGVTPFDSIGQPFDPQRHDAMSQTETTEVPPGYVAAEFLRGYLYRERLLRPAMVSVAKGPAAAAPAPSATVPADEPGEPAEGAAGAEPDRADPTGEPPGEDA